MFRWLSAFCLVLALFGFGPAVHAGQACPVIGQQVGDPVVFNILLDQGQVPEGSQGPDAPASDRAPAAQAEGETVVDVPLLFEAVRSPLPVPGPGAAPLRFGWTPVASPFIEGPRRPPRTLFRAA